MTPCDLGAGGPCRGAAWIYIYRYYLLYIYMCVCIYYLYIYISTCRTVCSKLAGICPWCFWIGKFFVLRSHICMGIASSAQISSAFSMAQPRNGSVLCGIHHGTNVCWLLMAKYGQLGPICSMFIRFYLHVKTHSSKLLSIHENSILFASRPPNRCRQVTSLVLGATTEPGAEATGRRVV